MRQATTPGDGPASAALVLTCARCGTAGWGVAPAPPMTAYTTVETHRAYFPDDPVPPNLPTEQPRPPLCVHCTEDWVGTWKDQWAEYYGGLL